MALAFALALAFGAATPLVDVSCLELLEPACVFDCMLGYQFYLGNIFFLDGRVVSARTTSQESLHSLCGSFGAGLRRLTLSAVDLASPGVNLVTMLARPLRLASRCLRLSIVPPVKLLDAVWMVYSPLLLLRFVARNDLFWWEMQRHDVL